HGSVGFLAQTYSSLHGEKVRPFPKDNPSKPFHPTAFLGYKADMTHIIWKVDRPTWIQVFAGHISDECKRLFYKNRQKSKNAITKYCKKWQDNISKTHLVEDFTSTKKSCQLIQMKATLKCVCFLCARRKPT
ncbi:hypothetical protein A6R68_13934, partial [Neotoma lepida]